MDIFCQNWKSQEFGPKHLWFRSPKVCCPLSLSLLLSFFLSLFLSLHLTRCILKAHTHSPTLSVTLAHCFYLFLALVCQFLSLSNTLFLSHSPFLHVSVNHFHIICFSLTYLSLSRLVPLSFHSLKLFLPLSSVTHTRSQSVSFGGMNACGSKCLRLLV